MIEYLTAIVLGIVEGLTEFLPVSSTGHLILLVDGLKFPSPPGHVFEVVIQIGAILAVMVLYRQKLIDTFTGIHKDPVAQKFAINIIVGTIPALIAGALLHNFIKDVLYNPIVIAVALIVGGIIILVFEKLTQTVTVDDIDDITVKQALIIGCCQTIALIPGVSRSGATIIGSLALGLSRKTSAEFSFFLAMPIMFCAVGFDLFENREELVSYGHFGLILSGLAAAFVSALLVVKLFIKIITRYGFAPFAYYRIALGLLAFVIFLK